MKVKIIASVALLSVFSNSYAKVIYTSGDWQLDDLSKKKTPNDYCIAYTVAEIGNTLYRLEFIHPKDKGAPTEIQIRQQGKGALKYTAQLGSGEIISFSNIGKSGKSDLIWNIPQNSSKIVAHLEGKKDLKFKPVDGSKDQKLSFSTSGFKKVREKFEEKCLAKSPLIDVAFENSFLLNQETLNTAQFSLESLVEVRRLLFSGYDVHLNINGTQTEMQKLRSKFQNQLYEASSLAALIERLDKRDIPSLIKDIKDNNDLQTRKTTELANLNALLKTQRISITNAEKLLASAEKIIAPFRAEQGSRSQNAYSARRNADETAARINSLDSSISQTNSRIGQLNGEAQSLEGNLNRLQAEVRPTRLEQLRAERDLRSFDGKQELVRRLGQDRGYLEARRELPQLESRLNILERALNEARAKILTREAELRACQARTSFFSPVESLSRLPAQERPNRTERPNRDEDSTRPNRPGRPAGDATPAPGSNPAPTQPSQPTTPEPTPTQPSTPVQEPTTTNVDCSQQVENLRQANVVEADIISQNQVAKRNLEAAHSRVNASERRVESDIQRINAQLENEAREAHRRLVTLEAQINSTDSRIQMIVRNEIPSLQNQLRNLQAQSSSERSQHAQIEPMASRLEDELNAYEARVGWDSKLSAVQNADRALQARNSEFGNTDAQRQDTESIIANCNNQRGILSQELSAKQLQKSQSETRLVTVKVSLEPFEAEKLTIEGKASNLKNQLAGIATEFEAKLPR